MQDEMTHIGRPSIEDTPNFFTVFRRYTQIFMQGCRSIFYSCGLHEEHVSDHDSS